MQNDSGEFKSWFGRSVLSTMLSYGTCLSLFGDYSLVVCKLKLDCKKYATSY